jgi:O-succinylbenzoate synthase
MKIRITVLVRFLWTQHALPLQARVLSFRAERSTVEKSLDLSVLQDISAEIFPMRVQPINQLDLLDSRPLLQLGFPGDRVTNITVMLIIDQPRALILEANQLWRPFCAAKFAVTGDLLYRCKERNAFGWS